MCKFIYRGKFVFILNNFSRADSTDLADFFYSFYINRHNQPNLREKSFSESLCKLLGEWLRNSKLQVQPCKPSSFRKYAEYHYPNQ